MPLVKNQQIPLTVTGMSAEGAGIGRIGDHRFLCGENNDPENFIACDNTVSGMVVFVPGTAVGDRISCHILRVEKSHAYGKIAELLEPSADRLPDEAIGCDVFGKCGGCVFRHVTYEAELRYKQQRVADALTRIGGLDVSGLIQPIVGSSQADGYRNKAMYPVRAGKYRLMAGFFAPNSHRLIEQHHCALQPPEFGDIVGAIVKWGKLAGVTGYDEETQTGLLRHIYLRRASTGGDGKYGGIMVCLVCTSGKLPQTKLLIELLTARVPAVCSVRVNINRADTNVVLGDSGFLLWGEEALTDELCGLRFRLSPDSFYQVNHGQAERLYRLTGEAAQLKKTDTLLDLYCGTGTIGLSLAGQVKRLIGVESVPAAVEDARKNAVNNNIDNARFICADAAEAAKQLPAEGIRPDVVIVDPPRKGCSPETLEAVAAMAPRRLVYVSCNPATLARDVALIRPHGYTVIQVTPVDMFPRTAHVECVAGLQRKDA
ncbi:MAG: 23S rRNA (uracil(1939)-C(5))-methyltransferase RlmD [Oscillospiraceae bacterium]|nr:23S rRNA (uracil(1939)-C(5))-methyltransferase RlmD [Oscillospiraceae bacterium]